jgi:hypothetical protein
MIVPNCTGINRDHLGELTAGIGKLLAIAPTLELEPRYRTPRKVCRRATNGGWRASTSGPGSVAPGRRRRSAETYPGRPGRPVRARPGQCRVVKGPQVGPSRMLRVARWVRRSMSGRCSGVRRSMFRGAAVDVPGCGGRCSGVRRSMFRGAAGRCSGVRRVDVPGCGGRCSGAGVVLEIV